MEFRFLFCCVLYTVISSTYGQDKTDIGNHIINFYNGKSCPTRGISFQNGKWKPKFSGKLLHFICNKGFTLIGNKMVACVAGEWSHPAPVCARIGCKRAVFIHPKGVIEETKASLENEVIAYDYSCTFGYHYSAEGNVRYCDGYMWKGSKPECTKLETISCDFENMTKTACNWTNDDTNDLDWKRHSEETLVEGTGPDYDHTFNIEGSGHYMYVDSSSIEPGPVAKLQSPWIYPEQDWCLMFWYHMYGADMDATLVVSLQTEKETLCGEFEPLSIIEGNQGKDWRKMKMPIPRQKSKFQVIFQATLNASDSSDIAIDDVWISPCSDMPTDEPYVDTEAQTTEVLTTIGMSSPSDTTLKMETTSEDSGAGFSTKQITDDAGQTGTMEEFDVSTIRDASVPTMQSPQSSHITGSQKKSKLPFAMGLVGASVFAVLCVALIICFVIKRKQRNLSGEDQDMSAFAYTQVQ